MNFRLLTINLKTKFAISFMSSEMPLKRNLNCGKDAFCKIIKENNYSEKIENLWARGTS